MHTHAQHFLFVKSVDMVLKKYLDFLLIFITFLEPHMYPACVYDKYIIISANTDTKYIKYLLKRVQFGMIIIIGICL